MADLVAIIAELAQAQGFRIFQDGRARWIVITLNGDRRDLGPTPTTHRGMTQFIAEARKAGIRWDS